MSKTVTTRSTAGFTSTSNIRDHELTVDATGEGSPDTLEVLLVGYASCFVPALRVAADQLDVGELGEITLHVEGQLNESDKLKSVAFQVETEANLDPEGADKLVSKAEQLCKVHDALKPALHATVELKT